MTSKLVRLREDTVKRLETIGQFGQSYDDVIKKILETKNE